MNSKEGAFNAALNAASIKIKDWNGGFIRRATATFNVPGVKGKMEVSVAVTPAVFSSYSYKTGVEVQVVHYKTPSNGTFIHWDEFGARHIDIGFRIDRLEELIKLATPSEQEVSLALTDINAAMAGYNQEMGLNKNVSSVSKNGPDYVIEIDSIGGPCYVNGDMEGDPGRTHDINQAERYSTENEARENMGAIRRKYPNRKYSISPMSSPPPKASIGGDDCFGWKLSFDPGAISHEDYMRLGSEIDHDRVYVDGVNVYDYARKNGLNGIPPSELNGKMVLPGSSGGSYNYETGKAHFGFRDEMVCREHVKRLAERGLISIQALDDKLAAETRAEDVGVRSRPRP